MRMNTQSELIHRTVISADSPARDGGASLLTEAFELIHSERETGKLTINFNQGGITSIQFDETTRVSQKALDEWDAMRSGNNGNHMATRGLITALENNS